MIDVDDLIAWLELPATPAPTAAKVALLQRCVDATISTIEDRYITPNEWTENFNTAALLVASRLYKRRASPEGVAGFGDYAVRVSREDPDVVALIGQHAKVGFA